MLCIRGRVIDTSRSRVIRKGSNRYRAKSLRGILLLNIYLYVRFWFHVLSHIEFLSRIPSRTIGETRVKHPVQSPSVWNNEIAKYRSEWEREKERISRNLLACEFSLEKLISKRINNCPLASSIIDLYVNSRTCQCTYNEAGLWESEIPLQTSTETVSSLADHDWTLNEHTRLLILIRVRMCTYINFTRTRNRTQEFSSRESSRLLWNHWNSIN